MVDWNNLYKVRLNSYEDAFLKHEIVKLILVKNLLQKYHSKKSYQEIYTEHKFNGKTCDVLHINGLTKEMVAYEIQKKVSKVWLKETNDFYSEKSIDWILIDLNKLSNDIQKLNKQIKELIV